MRAYRTEVSTEVRSSCRAAFLAATNADLPDMFRGRGPLPAITRSVNVDGSWNQPGQARVIYLSDSSECTERVREFSPYSYFSYTVSDFTGSLKALARSADGEWRFDQLGEGGTRIRWSYQFNATNLLAVPIIWLLGTCFWKSYMEQALENLAHQIKEETRAI